MQAIKSYRNGIVGNRRRIGEKKIDKKLILVREREREHSL